ncbi:hypothetical protein [Alteromonas facilis]|uniref:hypothetical protein n=1 Tax=Alteromonas facilis TaxID=2048004 RepID=UPI000C282954|nr:hypothetical protein [Alteromonas facilis]
MRKTTLLLTLGLGLSAHSIDAEAQFFDKLKEKAEKAAKALDGAESAQKKAGEASGAAKGSPSLEGGPSDDLVKFTNCAGLELENVTIGKLGDYEFQQGFSKEKRTGFIDRQPSSISKGCILPSIHSRQVIYMEVDSAKYKAMGSSNDWEMQCVRSDNPSAGALDEAKSEYPYKVDFLSPKHMMLHCGHNVDNADSCAEGSNSDRSAAWDKDLKSRGKTMLSVHGNTSTLAPPNGEKLYCQYYNKASGNSLFAFEYLRTRN